MTPPFPAPVDHRPAATTASSLLREWATETPDAVAITFDGEHLTFADLDREVDTWARALLAAGIQRGQAISVLAANHPHFLRAAFAAARVGAHLAPLNTWHTATELLYTLNHSEAVLLFATDRLRRVDYNNILLSMIPELAGDKPTGKFASCPDLHAVVALGEPLPGELTLAEFLRRGTSIDSSQLAAREAENTPADLMYVLYTSGSTSTPKGVQLQQGPAIENGWWMGERQGITAQDRSWVVTPLFYGVGAVQALFGTWSHGARVVLQEIFDPAAALRLLEEQQCTVYFGFGNLTRKLLAEPEFDRSRLFLRKGMIGFSVEDRRLAIDELGVTQGVSVFGMTELYGLAALTDHRDDRHTVMTTQGFPLPGNQIRITDPGTDEPLPAGEVGAIQIKGRFTPGYLKDPDRTAAALTADGFFRTGDLGALDTQGRLHYHSRATEMMKPAGVNVSPQEVESLLDTVPGITQAHVCSVPDPLDGEAVVAFIEADPAQTTPEFISNYLRQRASAYKVPRHYLYRTDEQMPRVASGKISLPLLRQQAEQELRAPLAVEGTR
jgi:fatty-acyl-CoA synthase